MPSGSISRWVILPIAHWLPQTPISSEASAHTYVSCNMYYICIMYYINVLCITYLLCLMYYGPISLRRDPPIRDYVIYVGPLMYDISIMYYTCIFFMHVFCTTHISWLCLLACFSTCVITCYNRPTQRFYIWIFICGNMQI